MSNLKKGDTIKCSKGEIIGIMMALEEEGYGTEFMYEKDGEKGYWIVITKGVRKNGKANCSM